jgi:cytochrome P450
MPGDTSIILNFVLMQRDPRVWGANAEEFDIDRWKDMGKEREGFMSWNYGPRMVSH